MQYIAIDRFEENLAVLEREDGSHFTLPRADLPQGAREGGILRVTESGYALDPAEEARRRKRLLDLQNSLFSEE